MKFRRHVVNSLLLGRVLVVLLVSISVPMLLHGLWDVGYEVIDTEEDWIEDTTLKTPIDLSSTQQKQTGHVSGVERTDTIAKKDHTFFNTSAYTSYWYANLMDVDEACDIPGHCWWSLQNQIHRNVSMQLNRERHRAAMGVYTILMEYGIIQDPVDGYGEREYAWVGGDTWRFSRKYHSSWDHYDGLRSMPRGEDIGVQPSRRRQEKEKEGGGQEEREKEKEGPQEDIQPSPVICDIMLMVDGVDTVASIEIDGQYIGSTSNMHRRYIFVVPDTLLERNPVKGSQHELSITIQSAVQASERRFDQLQYPVPYSRQLGAVGNYNMMRKTASDFGWDWGPGMNVLFFLIFCLVVCELYVQCG